MEAEDLEVLAGRGRALGGECRNLEVGRQSCITRGRLKLSRMRIVRRTRRTRDGEMVNWKD